MIAGYMVVNILSAINTKVLFESVLKQFVKHDKITCQNLRYIDYMILFVYEKVSLLENVQII